MNQIDIIFASPVSGAIPYFLIISLLILASINALRATRNYRYYDQIRKSFMQYQTTLDSANDYLSLTVHAISGAAALIGNAFKQVESKKIAHPDVLVDLRECQHALDISVGHIQAENQISAVQNRDDTFKLPQKFNKAYKSLWVWLPCIIVLVAFIATQIIFIQQEIRTFKISRIILETISLIIAIGLVFLAKKYQFISSRARKAGLEQLRAHAESLQKRRLFVNLAQRTLHLHSEHLRTAGSELKDNKEATSYFEGLSILAALDTGLSIIYHATDMDSKVQLISITEFLHNAVNDAQSKAAERRIVIKTDIKNDLNARIQPSEIRQLIYSLLDNAVVFNKPDGKITVTAREYAESIVMTVSDTGVGVSAAKMDKLFKPLVNLGAKLGFNQVGFGLSLYLDKVILTRLGGTIHMTSEVGTGTTVTVILPINHQQDTLRMSQIIPASEQKS